MTVELPVHHAKVDGVCCAPMFSKNCMFPFARHRAWWNRNRKRVATCAHSVFQQRLTSVRSHHQRILDACREKNFTTPHGCIVHLNAQMTCVQYGWVDLRLGKDDVHQPGKLLVLIPVWLKSALVRPKWPKYSLVLTPRLHQQMPEMVSDLVGTFKINKGARMRLTSVSAAQKSCRSATTLTPASEFCSPSRRAIFCLLKSCCSVYRGHLKYVTCFMRVEWWIPSPTILCLSGKLNYHKWFSAFAWLYIYAFAKHTVLPSNSILSFIYQLWACHLAWKQFHAKRTLNSFQTQYFHQLWACHLERLHNESWK